MTNKPIIIKFVDFNSTQKEIREITIKNIGDALKAARGNVDELAAWGQFARELKFQVDSLYGEALYGPELRDKQKLA